MCVPELFFVETPTGPVLVDKTFGVSEPYHFSASDYGRVFILQKRKAEQIGDANAGFTRPHDQNAVLLDLRFGHLQRPVDARETHARSPLDVVIEGALIVPVLLQQSERILVAEILELHQTLFALLALDRHEQLLNQRVLALVHDSLVLHADLQGVFQQCLVVARTLR